ncbi:hypothetical protein DFH06DRAFT_1297374 [Mycena polygramma]|nr:hypothetical protein DFH06DRAFT_1297374 [Mycena polygramma]
MFERWNAECWFFFGPQLFLVAILHKFQGPTNAVRSLSFPLIPQRTHQHKCQLTRTNPVVEISPTMTGFSDLIQKQEEYAVLLQILSMIEAVPRLQKAVESLKSQAPPVTDKKTAFWNAYMKVADEHDKEFKEKYSTDLDLALIFAGLFSAVSSAFIIQIQPQLTPDAPRIIVAVQGLLYTSLFTTLLAALLAVLGKQWVMHYQAAGSRGTIEERGLERQRKLDGLHKWKLDMVLQMFPLLLQVALLLFWSGLSVYLWPIHHSIAGLVTVLTLLGISSYILLLGSAILFPDSPFQTPLAPFLKPLFLTTFQFLQATVVKLQNTTRHVWPLLASSRKPRIWLLPSSSQQTSDFQPNQSVWEWYPNTYFSPSAEAPAIVWLLETSTDPIMAEAAAELAGDLQWPLDLDSTVAMGRLAAAFTSCFHASSWSPTVRNGLEHRAIHCGLALGSLRHLTQESGHDTGDSTFLPWNTLGGGIESQITLSSAQESQLLMVYWSLQIIRLLPATAADKSLVARIINTTVRLADTSVKQGDKYQLEELMTEICKFCSTFPLEQEPLPIVALANLATADDSYSPLSFRQGLQLTEWVFPVLEHVQSQWEKDPHEGNSSSTAVQGLLQFLAFTSSDCLPHDPPLPSVHLILRALSAPGHTSRMAYLTLCHAPHWFCNSRLQPVLRDSLVWEKLGQLAIGYYPIFREAYFSLGEKIMNTPEWQAVIHSDLPAWVMAFVKTSGQLHFDREEARFVSVLCSVWVPELTDKHKFLDEENKSWILAIEALGNIWESLEPLLAPQEYFRLAHCTAATSLRANFFHSDFRGDTYTPLPISRDIRYIFSAKLGRALVQSATKARNAVNMAASKGTKTPLIPVVDHIAEFLDVLGEKLSTEFEPTSGEVVLGGIMKPYRNWEELQKHFDEQLDALEEMLGVERVAPKIDA